MFVCLHICLYQDIAQTQDAASKHTSIFQPNSIRNLCRCWILTTHSFLLLCCLVDFCSCLQVCCICFANLCCSRLPLRRWAEETACLAGASIQQATSAPCGVWRRLEQCLIHALQTAQNQMPSHSGDLARAQSAKMREA